MIRSKISTCACHACRDVTLPMGGGGGYPEPLARAMACFMISRSIPPRGVVLAATPLFSPWEEEEPEEDCGS